MNSKFRQSILFTTALALSMGGAWAQNLTDVVVFGTDSSGNWYGQPDIWETRPGGNFNDWIWNGSSFLNGPTDAAARPNIPLSEGTHSFMIFGAPGVDNPNIGISLFFDGSGTPSISAYGPMLTSSLQSHVFSADSAPNTPMPVPGLDTGYLFPGAGTLSFTSGTKVITLTDFYLATPSVYNLDYVGQTTTGADGQLDYVGGITLNVTTVPEPQVATLGLGILAAGLLRRKLQAARGRA